MKLAPLMLAGALSVPGAAYAQNLSMNGSCRADATSVCLATSQARLTGASGDVILARAGGFSEIASGATLLAGDRIIVKKGRAAVELAPACRAWIWENAVFSVVRRGEMLCAARLPTQSNVVAQAQGGASLGTTVGVGLIAGGTAALFVSQVANSDRTRSTVSEPAN